MTMFISNISALQFLVSSGTPMRHVLGTRTFRQLEPTRSAPTQTTPIDPNKLRDLGIPTGIYTERLHLNVATREMRCRSKLVTCHVWNGPSRGSYLRIDNEYCVQTPEACFAQLARELPLSHLVELAMMLCGTYSPAPGELHNRYDVEPLTTPNKLAAYIARLEKKKGIENARVAIRLAESGSGSPMESKIAAMLALPTHYGGMGIPAKLNHEVMLTNDARGQGYHNTRRPDFMWPDRKVAMDYDSREYHDLMEMAQADELRRNELAAMGLNNIVARRHHFRNYLAFEALMGQLFATLKKSQKSEVVGLHRKRVDLFSQLFGNEQWRPMDIR